MNGETGGALSLVVGAVLVRLGVTGAHRRYVKPIMGPWLVIAGVVLVGLGGVALVRALRAPADADGDADGHHHDSGHVAHDGHGNEHDHGGERIAWLLLAPVLTLLLVAPPALGAFALGHSSTRVNTAGKSNWAPLVARDTPVTLSMAEFEQRAYGGGAPVFAGATVQLTGFVVKAAPEGFVMARYQIACCAADATAAEVHVVGVVGPIPGRDGWVTVTGTFDGVGPDGARLIATTVVPIRPPEDPYE